MAKVNLKEEKTTKFIQGDKQEESSSRRNIQKEIKRKLETIDLTRKIRIRLSERLKYYSRTWKFIFFVINIEAVIFVLLSLTDTVEAIKIGPLNMSFSLISGIFTIYVILLQYYINVLNYNERALQVHYHQLELEDLILQLDLLLVKRNTTEVALSENDTIEHYEQIVTQYQLALKNNENHRDLDYKRTKYDIKQYLYEEKISDEKPEGKRKKDFTLDMLLIGANMGLTVVMFLVIFYVVLF